jgi:hypothetical protein
LISGSPKTDSIFHTYRGETRASIGLCEWCFLSGYVDLPIAVITKEGQSVSKEKEYLYLKSPLSREVLQGLIDYVSGKKETEQPEEDLSETLSFLNEIVGKGFDKLSVLGVSKARLANVRGFALPSINDFTTLAGVYFPFDSLVQFGESVSGSVKRALIAATFYDLYLLTRSSLHYSRLGEGMFSIYGKSLGDRKETASLAYMEKANKIYELCSKHGRSGYGLNTGLFMLFFSDPRKAADLIFRKTKREDRALGEDKIYEVIKMVEEISEEDWVFNLGLEITGLLVRLGLLPRARSFWKSPKEKFTGVELVKWLQNFKMARDEDSTRSWATRVISGIKRERKEGPNEREVKEIMDLTEKIIRECKEHNIPLSEFSRKIADMGFYLLFYHNQKAKSGGE